MAPQPDRVMDVCRQLLTAVVTHHGGNLPERRLVTPGLPAWDCPLVATWCERTAGYQGDPATETTIANQRAAGWRMRVGTFVVEIVRPAASAGDNQAVPAVADIEADAADLYGDSQRVLDALATAAKADELPSCHSLAFLEWQVLGPSGGLVGSQLRVRVGLALGA